ncbi:MAG: HAD family phosphatase [Erysipelotrichaceae bacterium]|nr:HAD family phosphatase [Erysipelotrichaceae bacterium]
MTPDITAKNQNVMDEPIKDTPSHHTNDLSLSTLPDHFKGFLFDLDGTLIDSMAMWRRLMPELLEEKGIVLPRAVVKSMQGYTLEQVIRHVASLFSPVLNAEEMMTRFDSRLREEYSKHLPLKPDALEYLRFLKEKGACTAIVTTTDRIYVDLLVERLNLNSVIDVILTIADVGAGKNQPIIYHEAARHFGLEVGDCVVFEDAIFALNTARKAGYMTIGVKDPGAMDEALLAESCDLMIEGWK